jgi:hypothetical protein
LDVGGHVIRRCLVQPADSSHHMVTRNICILKLQARTGPLFEVHITHVIVLAPILRAVDELGGMIAEFVF